MTWITAERNIEMIDRVAPRLRCISWANRDAARDREYQLVINLEDDVEVARFARELRYRQVFGAYFRADESLSYTEESRHWFDMSLISHMGIKAADALKYRNRRSYQDLIFEGLRLRFQGERYLLPRAVPSELAGDVAIAPIAGPVWPMKGWDYYDSLRRELEGVGLKVNMLPQRATILEHIGDVQNHRCLVCGDSLPMHLALGLGVRCVTIFNCTSPWEIHGYGLLTKIISPSLEQFFYKRGVDERATRAVALEQVLEAVLAQLNS